MNKNIKEFTEFIKKHIKPHTDVLYHKILPAKNGAFEKVERLNNSLSRVLKKLGISYLYKHQIEAIELIRDKNHTVISTPTASGKSLIYNIAVIESIISDPSTTALYLFPLKALEQDQQKALHRLNDALKSIGYPSFSCSIFDGDTSSYMRTKIKRNPPNILITNPEMLHLSILPHHHNWIHFLTNLKFVVVDEVHTYRGILGSNMAWVFRRFIRICNFYGTYPTFILCSATIGNARELSQKLTGLEVKEVKKSYSPTGRKHFFLINPFLEGPVRIVLFLLKNVIRFGLRTIVYTQSRKMTELIGIWIEKSLPSFKEKIGVYRAGFLPNERREIEKKLRQKELIAVVSTSALELGIDIGSLDICILVGYPGSIMATWQRAGRVGRRQQDSAVILVAQEDSLDQYFIRNPEKFFELPPENGVINPFNPSIMEKQLLCAVADMPLKRDESMFSDTLIKNALKKMAKEFKIMETDDGTLYPKNKRIHHKVNLRGLGKEFIIFDYDKKRPIGTIDGYRAYHEAHKGAVYLHNKELYLVKDFFENDKTIWVKKENLKYYTRPRTIKNTKIISTNHELKFSDVTIKLGEVEIHEKIIGFDKIWSSSLKKLQFVPFENIINLTFKTCSIWIELPIRLKEYIEDRKLHFMGGIHAVEHLLIGILPLVILADRNDLGGISIPYHEQTKRPSIFIYDGYEGGIGLVEEAFKKVNELIFYGFDAIYSCDCENGCPKCIQSPKCGAGNRPLDKEAALTILSYLKETISKQKPQGIKSNITSSVVVKTASLPHFGVFDIETQFSAQEVGGWHRTSKMKMSYAVLYDSKKDLYLHFLEEDVDSFIKKLFEFELVVGFNIIKFDYNVLRGYSDPGFNRLPTLDILAEIYKKLNFRISLNNLAKSTLKISKKGDGLDALRWWKAGNLKKLGEYCEEDVRITKELFLFGHKKGYLMFTNKNKKVVKVYVDW